MLRHLHFILLLICTSAVSYSQGPPITTETPIMLGLEGNGIRTFGKYTSKESENSYVQVLAIPYNITARWQIGGIVPYLFLKPEGMKTVNGFGDVSVFTKFQLFKIDGKAKTFRILANIKQTFPTGSPATQTPTGTNQYQTYMGFIIGKISTKAGVYGDLGYNIASSHSPDNFIYNFSIGLPLLPQIYPAKQLNIYLEFNGNHIFERNINTFLISPGLQFIPGRRLLFESSFQIPVIQPNAELNKINYAVLLGTRFLIN